ncbi:hypothetical protein BGX24_002701 [Mortierella sp. AD032]|nr:hypothetical protein BGX24_002701 [Mortierella sp. AD032]
MDRHANTTQSADPKSTSSSTTFTMTNSSGIGNENDFQSNQATIIKILQDELQLQQAWVRAEKPGPWSYREQLEDAAEQLEEEISEIRGGLKDIAVSIAGGRK